MIRLLLMLALLAASAPAAADASDGAIARIDAAMAGAEGFGGAVIVDRGGEVLLSRGYGWADRERRIRFAPDTVAQIGSVTKTFTAAAIAALAAEGRLDLDATVGDYLPTASEPGRSRRLRDLLTHSSGLLDACGDDFERLSGGDVLGDCLARPLAHTPGEPHYSNLGYTVLAMVVEAVSGRDWEDHLRATIWEPLGMDDTGFRFAGRDQSRFARGYREGRADEVISRRIAELGGADRNLRGNGGIQASSEDMMRFLRALVRGDPAISPETRALMLAPHGPVVDGAAEGFGLFFRFDEQGELFRVGHAGSDGAFMSYAAWFPQSDTLLYFVGNNGEEPVREVLRAVLREAGTLPPAG